MVDQILQEIERKGYCFLPGLLASSDLTAINAYFDEHKAEFEAAKVGPVAHKQRLENIRGDYTFWIDPLNPPVVFSGIINFLDQLKGALNQKFFLGLKQFECHLAFYPPGTFYKKHSDRFESSSSRSLSFVFYLNEKWSEQDGGELVLYNKESDYLESIRPSPGSFICFLSEEFPHEVKSGKMERRSLTGWMHTKIIY